VREHDRRSDASLGALPNMLLFRLAFAAGLVGSSGISLYFLLSGTGISQSASRRTRYVHLSAYTAFQTVTSIRVGSLHHASDPFQMLPVLSPFAKCWAFPSSDYYDDSVPLEVSFRRESHVP
jgi:hypothetical protein